MSQLSSTLQTLIIVHLEQYSGPQFFKEIEYKNYIPIPALSQYSKTACPTRKQFPLPLTYAITAHKVANLSLFNS